MKVAIIAPHFTPDGCGSGVFSEGLASHLAKEHDVTIYTFFPLFARGYPSRERAANGMTVYRHPKPIRGSHILRSNRLTIFIARLLNYLLFGPVFIANFIFERFDIVHMRGQQYTSELAALLCILRGIPYVITLHGTEVYTDTKEYRPPARLFAFIMKRAAGIGAVSTHLKMSGEQAVGRAVTLLGHGVDPNEFLYKKKDKKDKKIIFTIQSLYKIKDTDFVIRIFFYVARRYGACILRVVGGGPEMDNLKRLTQTLHIADRVEFLGYLNHPELPPLFHEADIYISSFSLLPTYEALATGTPVVAKAIGGNGDIITHGENGYLLSSEKPEDYAEYLLRLLEDDVLRTKLGKSAYESSRVFQWPQVVHRYEDFYKKAMESPEEGLRR